MHYLLESKFELTGVFEGLVRNGEGKRRLRLQSDNGEILELKFPKELRKHYENRLRPGSKITVSGMEHRRMFHEAKRVISRLWILSVPTGQPSACAKCPIRVCAKKNCWKNGGKELWSFLEKRIAEEGLEDVVELRAVGCLKNCDRAPNAVYNREVIGRCSSHRAESIIEDIASKQRRERAIAATL